MNERSGKGGRKRLYRIISFNEMLVDFMSENKTFVAVFILRRLQDEYHAKAEKLYMCFVFLEKAFATVPRNVLE